MVLKVNYFHLSKTISKMMNYKMFKMFEHLSGEKSIVKFQNVRC